MTDESGAVIKTYEYDSFGNEVNQDSKDENPFRYCGEYYDKETEEEIMINTHHVKITNQNDYEKNFYSKYIDDKCLLQTKFLNDCFIFDVEFPEHKDIDEQILFEFYLITCKFGGKNFKLNCCLNKTKEESIEEYYRLSTYGYIQQNIDKCFGQIRYSNNLYQKMQNIDLKGVSRLVPVFRVTEETLCFLKNSVKKEKWDKIKNGNKNRINTFENIIYRLCWSFLFREIKMSKELTKLRRQIFETSDFQDFISDIPLLALLIFSMLDFSFREEAIEKYKEEIKKITKKGRIQINETDLLYHCQNVQKREHFEAYRNLLREKYDNKTIAEGKENKKVHPFIIRELYEAITISEGILQLMDNVVKHAGENNKGRGLISFYMRSYKKDRTTLDKKYEKYFKKNAEYEKSKYYLEIILADLSGTTIPNKFWENNKDFINTHKDDISEKMKGFSKDIDNFCPHKMQLKDFFYPEFPSDEFWHAFFSYPDKAINHYGLQIFDSIISSKRGLFKVNSGQESYSNLENQNVEENIAVHGTKYTIFCPLSEITTIDNNIYDSMFGYDYTMKEKEVKELNVEGLNNINNYIQQICDGLKNLDWKEDKIIWIDLRKDVELENLIKGVLLYIYTLKVENKEKSEKLFMAFLHCKPHHIINIVRILSIYYDKQGTNIKMEGVQIYLRGEHIGEEVLFYGRNLNEVSKNIAKSSCMRGIMFDNFQTVNKLLERNKKEEEK